jgi:hypothetical protein
MRFDDVLRNPLLQKALQAGEAQAGKVVGRLLSSEAVTSGLQNLLSAASSARATFNAGVQGALKAANLPSAGDVQALRQKIGELEQLIDDLSARLDQEEAADLDAVDEDAASSEEPSGDAPPGEPR